MEIDLGPMHAEHRALPFKRGGPGLEPQADTGESMNIEVIFLLDLFCRRIGKGNRLYPQGSIG